MPQWQEGHQTYVVLTCIDYLTQVRVRQSYHHSLFLEENTLKTSSRFGVFQSQAQTPKHKTHHLWDVSGSISTRWWDHKNQMLWVEGKTLDIPRVRWYHELHERRDESRYLSDEQKDHKAIPKQSALTLDYQYSIILSCWNHSFGHFQKFDLIKSSKETPTSPRWPMRPTHPSLWDIGTSNCHEGPWMIFATNLEKRMSHDVTLDP